MWRGRSGLRVPVLALAYAAALLATNVWLESASPRTEHRVLVAMSTDLAHLGRDPWLVLPGSAFFTRGGLPFAIAGCLICVGLLEMTAGRRLTALIAVTGHVVGTLVSEGIVLARITAGDLPDSARHALDVGPSYILVACGVAFVVWPHVDTRLRVGVAASLAPLFVFTAWRLPAGRIDAIGHVIAAVTGLVMAWWVRRRRRSSAVPESVPEPAPSRASPPG